MKQQTLAALLLAGVPSALAFAPTFTSPSRTAPIHMTIEALDEEFWKGEGTLPQKFEAGNADTEFAKRFGHLAGKPVKTVAETFADFTKFAGRPINALFRNMVMELVTTTHLIVVDARFERDPIWSLGLSYSLDVLLENYPGENLRDGIKSAIYKSMDLDEEASVKEAKELLAWAEGKTKDDIKIALTGEGDSAIAETAKKAKGNDFWKYSQYFGIGLIRLMEAVDVEMSADAVYPVMEDWMMNGLDKPRFTALNDSDFWFKVKAQLDMTTTLMKEVEIREKKRMAERLEAKAEVAIRMAEKEAKMKDELAKVEAIQAENEAKAEAEAKEAEAKAKA